jgi:hypothetical protein
MKLGHWNMCEINWNLVLEFTKVLLSAPPMTAAIAIFILLLFRKEIATKIRDLIKASGAEFAQPQPQSSEANAFNEPTKVEITGEAKTGQAQIIAAKGHLAFESGEPTVTKPWEMPDILKDDPYAEEQIQMAKDDPYSYVAKFKRVSFELHYERIFQWIYGTQVKLLQQLALTDEAYSVNDLSKFDNEHLSLVGTGDKMYMYMDFLKNWRLIAENKNGAHKAYRITEFGKSFLRYIVEQYPDHWDNKPS